MRPACLCARNDLFPCIDFSDQFFEDLRRQILIGILENLNHRRIHTSAGTFHLFPREIAIFGQGEMAFWQSCFCKPGSDLPHRATCRASCHTPEYALSAPTGCKLELGVEGRHFQHANVRHRQACQRHTSIAGFADPAFLLLCPHQKRNHSRGLTAFRIFVRSHASTSRDFQTENSKEAGCSLCRRRTLMSAVPILCLVVAP